MKRVCSSLFILACAHLSLADHIPTHASWNGWTVQTAEEVWFESRHTSYPIWKMFDGDAKTAWVYSGGFIGQDTTDPQGYPIKRPFRPISDRYSLVLQPDKAVRIDEIRIMNGYNKDSFTFGRNARITEIEVFDAEYEGKLLGRFKLPDRMGEHSVKIPRRKYETLRIVARSIVKGTDPDVAISELRLLDKGRDVGPGKPEYVVFSAGDECGCGGSYQLMRPDGRVVAEAVGEASSIVESPNGRYFAGAHWTPKALILWVYDATRGRFATRNALPKKFDGGVFPEWKADGRLTDFDGTLLWSPR